MKVAGAHRKPQVRPKASAPAGKKSARDQISATARDNYVRDPVRRADSRSDTLRIQIHPRRQARNVHTTALRMAQHFGRATIIAGLALDAHDLWHASELDRVRADGQQVELEKAVGRVAGGWVGATAGAFAGAAIGSVVPVVGTAIGGVLGGFAAGIAGSIAGEAWLSRP